MTLTGLVRNEEVEPLQTVGADVQSKLPLSEVLCSTKVPKPHIIRCLEDTSSTPTEFKILRVSPPSHSQSLMKSNMIPNRKVIGEWILNKPKDTH